ncbi:MAG TPA: pentapeptide repeat-containing protein [Gemmataceae bacterium]|nr:pentapeptide repeat-containing protein [Gemmataceae bacterium]
MIEAKRALVRPRVRPIGNTSPRLLNFVEAGAYGNIALQGPAGSGKTTALAHLAATLGPDVLEERVSLLDEPARCQLVNKPARLVIYTTRRCFPDVSHLGMYDLSPWSRDDVIEYLLAVHRPLCASVMARIQGEDHLLLGGLPELWRIVLDQLASAQTLPDVRRALHRHLEEHLSDTDLLERARSACLNVAVNPEFSLTDAVMEIAQPGFADRLIRLLRYPAVQMMLSSERIAADLPGAASCDYLAKRLPRHLVEAAGRLIASDNRALEHLHALLARPSWSHAMAVSLLHAAGASASLKHQRLNQLAGAYLEGVSWSGIILEGATLAECDLTGAHLSHSCLAGADLRKSTLRQACLQKANCNEVFANEADISEADLTLVHAYRAYFDYATLEKSDLSGGYFEKCSFQGTNLRRVSFREANLREAIFQDAELEGADFTSADLSCADLTGQCLRHCCWLDAYFRRTVMDRCDLEYLVLSSSDFRNASLRGALLTGSTMPGADFREACLHNAGLADIEWEGADLRGADLRGASFHMGSTRSGLVGSPIPCEGSKTGFYTDDYGEQTYKAPEEIRKANLCGADLRGAILDGVDFYLVDLRGALYDEKYADHLRRCGAILEARV